MRVGGLTLVGASKTFGEPLWIGAVTAFGVAASALPVDLAWR